jgi:hypothetical protein
MPLDPLPLRDQRRLEAGCEIRRSLPTPVELRFVKRRRAQVGCYPRWGAQGFWHAAIHSDTQATSRIETGSLAVRQSRRNTTSVSTRHRRPIPL